jgi:hypothetical protein
VNWRVPVHLVSSLCICYAAPARAEAWGATADSVCTSLVPLKTGPRLPPAPPRALQGTFVVNIRLYTEGSDVAVESGVMVNQFKQLLEMHGYQANNCAAVTEDLGRLKERTAPRGDGGYQRVAQLERLIAHTQCAIPEAIAMAHAYDAELTLSVDANLKNQRAVLRLTPLADTQHPLPGGFALRPGAQQEQWYDIMNAAIERTMGNINDPTSISLVLPDSAKVGETVHINGHKSWDSDGDAFELMWRVTTEVCEKEGEQLPVNNRLCPDGWQRRTAEVAMLPDEDHLTRRFVVPMVGDYAVHVFAKTGLRTEPEWVCPLRAYPRRPHMLFVNQTMLRLPRNFMHSTQEHRPATLFRVGYAYRSIHRIGILGAHEEIYAGGSIASLVDNGMFEGNDVASGFLFGMEIVERFSRSDGRFGFATSQYVGSGAVAAKRGDVDVGEAILAFEVAAGLYYQFGRNFIHSTDTYCDKYCPSFMIGPTVGGLMNLSTHKRALIGGGQVVMGVSF